MIDNVKISNLLQHLAEDCFKKDVFYSQVKITHCPFCGSKYKEPFEVDLESGRNVRVSE